MTTQNPTFETLNMTTEYYNSTLANTTTYQDHDIKDSYGHNALARIGYYYPLRVTETMVGFVGNFMVILAVSRYRDLQTATGSLMANLALADLLGASLTIFSIIGETMERTTRWLNFCIGKEILYIIAAFGNIISLSMISIDRLISLSNPWWYYAKMTMKKVLPYQIISWIGIIITYSLLLTLRSIGTLSMPTCVFPFLISRPDARNFMLLPFLLFTGITILNYMIVGYMGWKQGRNVTAQNSTMGAHMLQRHRKLSKTTALVLVIYLVLTVPVTIASFMVKGDKSAGAVHAEYIALVTWHLNSVVNPFIYAYRIPKFRKAFRLIMGLKPNVVAVAAPEQAPEGPAPIQISILVAPAQEGNS